MVTKKEILTQYHRENIVTAAKQLFETKGITVTTVDDIAKAAGISKSTMYVYFKKKEEIIDDILLEQIMYLKMLLQKCIKREKGTQECYYAICKEMVKFQKQYPVYFPLLLGEIQVTEKAMSESDTLRKIYLVGEEINDMIVGLLQAGIEDGTISEKIQVIPTVWYLGAGISQIILFADSKQEYIKKRMGMKKQAYMDYTFALLFNSIKKGEGC